jgi:hypothetical protein
MKAQQSDDPGMIEECAQAARALLHRNLTAHGILAATPSVRAEKRRYTRIFGRDASICALAMALSGDPALVAGARASLATLAQHQADNGQIPKYVDPEEQEPDFWYLGCIDATLWWLIAVDFMATHAPQKRFAKALAPAVERALAWLHAQEHPRLHLVQQNEASDWADIMPRSGFVLYSNALWYHVKCRYQLATVAETRFHFNHLFHPFSRDLPEYHRLRLLTHYVRQQARRRDLYLSFVNFSFFGDEGDVFGNLLAILFGLAETAQSNRILRALDRAAVGDPVPVRVTCTPISRRDPLWRLYMARHRQNLEHQYHNGGCWPFVGGFWVMALATCGRQPQAQQELVRLAAANRRNHWQFNEWFHGKSGVPRGMPGQSWNAAAFLLAQHALKDGIYLSPDRKS